MSLSSKTVIFSAPPAWGKSTRSEELRKEFGCTHVVDCWSPGFDRISKGALHLTNASPTYLQQRSGNFPDVRIVTRGW